MTSRFERGGEFAEFSFEETGEQPWENMDPEAPGIDPTTATVARPGTEGKVLMLGARYAAGEPLWHGGDCYHHAPIADDIESMDNPARSVSTGADSYQSEVGNSDESEITAEEEMLV